MGCRRKRNLEGRISRENPVVNFYFGSPPTISNASNALVVYRYLAGLNLRYMLRMSAAFWSAVAEVAPKVFGLYFVFL
jgi:hypothetical protein